MVDADSQDGRLESREPALEDLVELCRGLNEAGAHYMVIGGFAMRAAGYDRRTMDIDLLVEASLENESKVIAAVGRLPDRAALELTPGEIAEYGVVRVADEIVVDLMKSASGIEFDDAKSEASVRTVLGVPIPFASERLLLRMKDGSVRDKDRADAAFLRRLLSAP